MSEFGAWGDDEAAATSSPSSDPLHAVRRRMEQVARDIAEYSRQISDVGTALDGTALRSKIKAKRTALTTACQQVKAELQTVQGSVDRVQFERITKQFHDQVKRLDTLSKDANTQITLNAVPGGQGDSSDERTPLTSQQQTQQMQNQQVDLDLAEQRRKDLESVERDMTGLRDAFVDLNNLVQEQGEDIIRIEEATNSAADNTGEAASELNKARISQSKARKKCIILGILLLIVLAIIVIIIVVVTKPWENHDANNDNPSPPPPPPPTPPLPPAPVPVPPLPST